MRGCGKLCHRCEGCYRDTRLGAAIESESALGSANKSVVETAGPVGVRAGWDGCSRKFALGEAGVA